MQWIAQCIMLSWPLTLNMEFYVVSNYKDVVLVVIIIVIIIVIVIIIIIIWNEPFFNGIFFRIYDIF